MHALTDTAQKVCKKKQGQQPTQTNKRRVLVETEDESVVSLGYNWPGMGAKAHRPAMSPQDRSWNPYKSPPTFFQIFFLLSPMSPFRLATPGHPSHYLFAYFHLGRIQHHTRRQWLPLCVIFSVARDGRVCLSVTISSSHKMTLFRSYWIPYKMVVFASVSHIEHHARGVCLLFEFHYHTNASVGLCVSYST